MAGQIDAAPSTLQGRGETSTVGPAPTPPQQGSEPAAVPAPAQVAALKPPPRRRRRPSLSFEYSQPLESASFAALARVCARKPAFAFSDPEAPAAPALPLKSPFKP
jgi:hypothetical protein